MSVARAWRHIWIPLPYHHRRSMILLNYVRVSVKIIVLFSDFQTYFIHLEFFDFATAFASKNVERSWQKGAIWRRFFFHFDHVTTFSLRREMSRSTVDVIIFFVSRKLTPNSGGRVQELHWKSQVFGDLKLLLWHNNLRSTECLTEKETIENASIVTSDE